MLIWGPKMTHFSYFGHNENFPLKSKTFTLNHLLMPVIRYNQEILIKRFRKKFKRVDFGSKNGPFTSFWAKQEFFSTKGLRYFSVFIES